MILCKFCKTYWLLSEFGIFTKSVRKKLKKVLSSTEGINVGFWNSVQKLGCWNNDRWPALAFIDTNSRERGTMKRGTPTADRLLLLKLQKNIDVPVLFWKMPTIGCLENATISSWYSLTSSLAFCRTELKFKQEE